MTFDPKIAATSMKLNLEGERCDLTNKGDKAECSGLNIRAVQQGTVICSKVDIL